MKTYSLRTVYSVKNLQFSDEVVLRKGVTQIQLVRRRELPISSYELVSISAEGKREVRVSTKERVHQGTPLLLEVVANCQAADNATPFDVRPSLEAQTAIAVGQLAWSWPDVVGPKLGEGLFLKENGSWAWYDADMIRIGDCYELPERLSAALAGTETSIAGLPPVRQAAAEAAVRWWRQSQDVESPADRLIACWIILEIASFAVCAGGSIHDRVKNLLVQAFPQLAQVRSGALVSDIEKTLSGARNRAMHGGRRDVEKPNATVQLASAMAKGSISYLLGHSASPGPSDELLLEIGIKTT